MSEQELPPRPWMAEPINRSKYWQVVSADDMRMATVDTPELACLWAAAPELAEALEQFVHFIDIDLRAIIARDNRDEDERREIWIELVMNAQAALARARGEAVAR